MGVDLIYHFLGQAIPLGLCRGNDILLQCLEQYGLKKVLFDSIGLVCVCLI